jgi:hypothetical protein
MIKKTIHDWFWLIGLVLFAGGSLVIARVQPRLPIQQILVLGGGIAGFYYFLQKQVLEELSLFERLFADFNKRYCEMNEALQRLMKTEGPLTAEHRALLEDYFNLCAEEYLYRTYGIIDLRVWRAWCRGMLQYLHDPRVSEFWQKEEADGTYYGLTLAEIERAAGPPDVPSWSSLSEDDARRDDRAA